MEFSAERKPLRRWIWVNIKPHIITVKCQLKSNTMLCITIIAWRGLRNDPYRYVQFFLNKISKYSYFPYFIFVVSTQPYSFMYTSFINFFLTPLNYRSYRVEYSVLKSEQLPFCREITSADGSFCRLSGILVFNCRFCTYRYSILGF